MVRAAVRRVCTSAAFRHERDSEGEGDEQLAMAAKEE